MKIVIKRGCDLTHGTQPTPPKFRPDTTRKKIESLRPILIEQDSITKMLKRMKKIFLSNDSKDTQKEVASLATITIHTPEESVDAADTIDEFKSNTSEQDMASTTEQEQTTQKHLMKLELSAPLLLLPQPTTTPSPGLEAYALSLSSTSSEEDSDDSMGESQFTDSSNSVNGTNAAYEENASHLDAQAECIRINNEGLQTQYEQMTQNQLYLEQQEQAYRHNQNLANELLEQIQEYQCKNEYLQHQIYYHRAELDRLAEQVITYEGAVQRLQNTIREQEERIDNNHKLLAYDNTLVTSLGQAFQAQAQAQPSYTSPLVTLALMNYTA